MTTATGETTTAADRDHAVTAAAWGWVDEMDQPDPQRIVAFYYREHVDRGPEDAL